MKGSSTVMVEQGRDAPQQAPRGLSAGSAVRPRCERSSIWACRRCVRRTSSRNTSTRWSRSIRCMRWSASNAFWSSSTSSSRRATLRGVCVLLLVFRLLDRACSPVCGGHFARFGLGANSLVMEIASNDGYLLQHFVQEGVPVSASSPQRTWRRWLSRKACGREVKFFGSETPRTLAAKYRQPDLIIGNNVLAHAPFSMISCGAESCWRQGRHDDGIPAPHAADAGQPVRHDLSRALLVFLVCHRGESLRCPRAHAVRRARDLPTHGGSLRIYARHAEIRRSPRPGRACANARIAVRSHPARAL